MNYRVLFFSLTIFILCAEVHAQQYTVQSIGGLLPAGINDSSEVAGTIYTDGVGYTGAAVWANGNTTPIIPPGSLANVEPYAINNSGQVLIEGNPSVYPPFSQSFIWDSVNGFNSVAAPDGQSASLGAMNNHGQGGGYLSSIDGNAQSQPAIWLSPQTPTILPLLSSTDTFGGVLALNDVGDAVGSTGYSAPLPAEQAVLWQDGAVIGLTPGHSFSRAFGINNADDVIGYYFDYDNEAVDVPFMWDKIDGLTVLPDLGGSGRPSAINQEGQIVGQAFDPTMTISIAALWQDGTFYDLNDLLPADSGWVLQIALGINDQGQIVGWGTYDGEAEGFLLTPIPEPAVLSMAIGICLLVRRSSKYRGSK